ncbi:MAG: hypothetical protein KDD70_08930, partial [Bdellovibrionales bacterium]|nr:hypothetical protein [Bdellovibrionales bacterium]
INGSIIMSYNTKEDSDYSIFKIELTDKDLKAIALNEGAPQFKTKEEFVAFLSSKNSAEWFKEGYHFVRK